MLVKKRLSGAFLAVMSLAGCGDKPSETTNAPTNTYVSPLPADAPTVTVVTNSSQPPFVFLDGYGNLQGMDVDIIRAIGEKEGFKVEFHDEPFANILPAIEQRKYQVAMAAFSYTAERASKYGHTNSYLYSPSVALYRADLNLQNIKDVAPLRVSAMPNTKQYTLVQNLGTKNINPEKSVFGMIQGVLQNKYDAVLQDKLLLEYVLANHSEHRDKFKFLEYEDASEPSSQLVFYTNQNDQALVEKINRGIDKLKAEGKIEEITNNYLKQKSQTAQ